MRAGGRVCNFSSVSFGCEEGVGGIIMIPLR